MSGYQEQSSRTRQSRARRIWLIIGLLGISIALIAAAVTRSRGSEIAAHVALQSQRTILQPFTPDFSDEYEVVLGMDNPERAGFDPCLFGFALSGHCPAGDPLVVDWELRGGGRSISGHLLGSQEPSSLGKRLDRRLTVQRLRSGVPYVLAAHLRTYPAEMDRLSPSLAVRLTGPATEQRLQENVVLLVAGGFCFIGTIALAFLIVRRKQS